MKRREQILEIIRNNAREGLDQNRVEDYRDNMSETIACQFPDLTIAECEMAEDEFNRLVSQGG